MVFPSTHFLNLRLYILNSLIDLLQNTPSVKGGKEQSSFDLVNEEISDNFVNLTSIPPPDKLFKFEGNLEKCLLEEVMRARNLYSRQQLIEMITNGLDNSKMEWLQSKMKLHQLSL